MADGRPRASAWDRRTASWGRRRKNPPSLRLFYTELLRLLPRLYYVSQSAFQRASGDPWTFRRSRYAGREEKNFERSPVTMTTVSHIRWKHLHRLRTGTCDIIILRLLKLLKQHKTGAEFLPDCCIASWDFVFGFMSVEVDFPFKWLGGNFESEWTRTPADSRSGGFSPVTSEKLTKGRRGNHPSTEFVCHYLKTKT